MKYLLLVVRNCDGIFTVKYKEIGMEHYKFGLRNWDLTFTVRYKEDG